jgi:hypothetical protein
MDENLNNGTEALIDVAPEEVVAEVENNTTVQDEATATPATSSTSEEEKQDVKVETFEAKAQVSKNPITETAPLRSIPLIAEVKDDADEVKSFAESLKLDKIREAVFEIVPSAGRGGGARFIPSADLNRPVKTYLPKNGDFAVLKIGRNSDKPSEGGLIGSIDIERGFKFRFLSAKHQDPISLVLVDGRSIDGYVLKGEAKGGRRAFYLPKHLVEGKINLPQKGTNLKIEVAKLIVG